MTDTDGRLVLTRRPGEAVHLTTADGTRVAVHVVRVNGEAVQLMFTAPRSVEILRDDAVRTTKGGGRK